MPPNPLLQLVPIPAGVNAGLTSPPPSFMEGLLGSPGTPPSAPGAVCGTSSPAMAHRIVTADVGPFRVTGLRVATESLARVFARAKTEQPALFGALGTAGMTCVRHVGGSTEFSNHAWGSAIDITIAGQLTQRGAHQIFEGYVLLAPFFHAEKWFWGAEFSHTPDAMHFEASRELLTDWKAQGKLG